MLPYIHIIVPFYGVFVILGIIAAFLVFMKRGYILSLGMLKNIQVTASAAIGMLIGSRIVFVLIMLPAIIKSFSLKQIVRIIFGGGFVFYGGLFGAIAGLYCYGKIRKINLDNLFQAIVPCFPIFHAFGRIGCFMAGCCYGIPCKFGFAMAANPDVVRFPVQLVESICCLMIFVMLLIIEKHFSNIKLLDVYLISYAVTRFGLEFLRGDSIRGFFLCFSTSQWISLGILIIFAIKIITYNEHKTVPKRQHKQENI